MSGFRRIIENDLKRGLEAEDHTLPFIKKHFGDAITRTAPVFGNTYAYDFYDPTSNVMVELKTRFDKAKHDTFPDSTISFNKIKYAIENPEKDCYVIVKYTDGFWCVKITDEVKNLKPFWFKKNNGEVKYNVGVPTSLFYKLD